MNRVAELVSLLEYYKNKNNYNGGCKPVGYYERVQLISNIEIKIDELTKELLA